MKREDMKEDDWMTKRNGLEITDCIAHRTEERSGQRA